MPAGRRHDPIGAEFTTNGVSFRVWAPDRTEVRVVVHTTRGEVVAGLRPDGDGYWEITLPDVRAGDRYAFRLDADPTNYPDPASRSQPDGPHGLSTVIDPRAFGWTDTDWKGLALPGQVLYEMHVGTFSESGTWAGAAEKLGHLADLGVTCIEVMPVADFPGRFGWGYDGVSLFAPSRLYGTPDEFRTFVDRAHALGIGVILDVVYNHLGPDGNYLKAFSQEYFTDRYKTDWGEALNYDGPGSRPVRDYFLTNAAYWIREFHLDGFRFDATQNIYDASPLHILAEIADRARAVAAPRSILLIAENEEQKIHHVSPRSEEGYGLDALWNDDFHHAAIVALTGHSEAYYSDYRGTPQELISSIKRGYLFQGQSSHWQKKRRGSSALMVPPPHFVTFLENHDQVANSAHGMRRHQLGHPAQYRALTAVMLLAPATPLLFQGQEFVSSAPFLYFADHQPELARLVSAGRKQFLSQFPSLTSPEMQAGIPDPAELETFERCRLDWAEREQNGEALALHRDLLALRRSDPVLASQSHWLDGAVLGEHAFVIRFFADDGLDRLLLVNLGQDFSLSPAPEPLLADPPGGRWEVRWCSEGATYGGSGVPPIERDHGWFLPQHSALFLVAREQEES